MIKIIRGYYGYKKGNSIIPKSAKDAPFSCDKAEEERLVKLGVAEFVTGEAVKVEAVEVSKDDLIAQYTALGLKGNPSSMKVETLKAKIADAKKAEEVETEEDAPTFNEVDGVVE